MARITFAKGVVNKELASKDNEKLKIIIDWLQIIIVEDDGHHFVTLWEKYSCSYCVRDLFIFLIFNNIQPIFVYTPEWW